MKEFDVENLRKWFLAHQRDLPWRQNPTPYAVWVSEVMLQQTQVAVVIPYFERWMHEFPTIQHLASAHTDKVIKMWEGLGYYARARHLHAGAQQVVKAFGGNLPKEESNLKQIKGLGPYTIGAIRAFAFKEKAAAVDGNVLRVLSRHDAIQEDITKAKTILSIRHRASKILPDHQPWVISEALIELGATICGRTPKCSICPLRKSCRGLAMGLTTTLPVKSKKTKTSILYRTVVVIISGERCLIRRGEKGEIMRDLHEFPYFETEAAGMPTQQLITAVLQKFGITASQVIALEPEKQGFTRYEARLAPTLLRTNTTPEVPGYCWMSFTELDQLAFSSGHRRIYHTIKNSAPDIQDSIRPTTDTS